MRLLVLISASLLFGCSSASKIIFIFQASDANTSFERNGIEICSSSPCLKKYSCIRRKWTRNVKSMEYEITAIPHYAGGKSITKKFNACDFLDEDLRGPRELVIPFDTGLPKS